MAHLLLVRHGKSEWNNKGLWTGWTDVDLNDEGVAEAKRAGEAISDIAISVAHVSELKRAKQTLEHIKKTIGSAFDAKSNKALNERNYGLFTGKNKWEVKEQIGEAEFQRIRRGWDVPIPEGESLKQVFERVAPYFDEHILPDLKKGKHTLVVAHGNSLRALMKHIEGLSEEAVCDLEVGTGEIHCYTFDEMGKMLAKEIRASNPNKGKI